MPDFDSKTASRIWSGRRQQHDELGPVLEVLTLIIWGCVYTSGAYAAAHVMFYAFHGVLGLPISFAWCFFFAMLPLVNVGGCILAGTILTWKYMLIFGLKALIWLLSVIAASMT